MQSAKTHKAPQGRHLRTPCAPSFYPHLCMPSPFHTESIPQRIEYTIFCPPIPALWKTFTEAARPVKEHFGRCGGRSPPNGSEPGGARGGAGQCLRQNRPFPCAFPCAFPSVFPCAFPRPRPRRRGNVSRRKRTARPPLFRQTETVLSDGLPSLPAMRAMRNVPYRPELSASSMAA